MLKAVCDARPGTSLALWELLCNLPEFFRMVVSVGATFRVFSSRRAYYGLVWSFSTSVFSPGIKRGKSCSGNRGLGIGIKADNSRFFPFSWFPSTTLASRGRVAKTLFSGKQFLSGTDNRRVRVIRA